MKEQHGLSSCTRVSLIVITFYREIYVFLNQAQNSLYTSNINDFIDIFYKNLFKRFTSTSGVFLSNALNLLFGR